MKVIDNIFERVYKLLLALACIFLALMIIIIFINVVLRYAFNSGLHWSEEVSLTLVVWFTCIAFVLGVHESKHISINVLPANTPKQILNFCEVLKNLVGISIGFLFLIYGFILTVSMREFSYTAIAVSASFRYIFLPISGIFVIYFSIKSLVNKKSIEDKGDR